ncbi:MAG: GNAT family N-acetyltransferase [Clostridium sp.]|uniref:GNAT family N-acetyltransferase n=1 Tax=Clostridium sp. TaxID=1506 RepID=UPI003047D538
MAVQFRNYTKQVGITEDYYKVRAFLIKLGYCEFTYARWDWMTTHGYLDKSALGKIGLWEDEGELVALASYDTTLGCGFCLTYEKYRWLKGKMLDYAKKNFIKDKYFRIVIQDKDIYFQDIAAKMGFVATTEKENDAVYYMDRQEISYDIPERFHITSMEESYDLFKYGQVLWKGFNHEIKGEGKYVYTEEEEQCLNNSMKRANVDLNLKIAMVAPNGDFVAYCGMWHDPSSGYAVIEPVATDPAYRKMGLGKAVVLEGIKRCGNMGAKQAFVGSSQQFYYSIGLVPYETSTLWKEI